jgi:hypothetical protein
VCKIAFETLLLLAMEHFHPKTQKYQSCQRVVPPLHGKEEKKERNLRVLEYVTNNRNAEREEETRSSTLPSNNCPRQNDASRTPFSIY